MANGTIAFDTLSTSGQITGTAKSVDTDYLASGSAKSWANLNGTGTIALRDSLNVASITDDGTGDYDFTYTNAMGNVNYSIQMGNSFTTTSAWANFDAGGEVPTTAFFNMSVFDRNGSAQDATYAYFGIDGDLA